MTGQQDIAQSTLEDYQPWNRPCTVGCTPTCCDDCPCPSEDVEPLDKKKVKK